jgi:hypothetical protein
LWAGRVNLKTNGLIGAIYKTKETRELCLIQDLEFWDTQVNAGAVNTHGWVLQEHLMAPRIIHFCEDQIAWECAEFDASESQPDGLSDFRLTSDGLRSRGQVKGLDPEHYGRDMRRSRLPLERDPDHQQPKILAF